MLRREIIDNSEKNKLVSYLQEQLQEQEGDVDVATGFFNIDAYKMVKEEIEGVDNFRLLLGKAPRIDSEKTLGDRIKEHVEENVEDMDFTEENKSTVEKFIDFLKQPNVSVRLYDREFLHGKTYIFDESVVIGSSNFTAAGLTQNTELNSVAPESKARYAREEWFSKFWEQAKDFKKELIDLLEKSRFGSREYSPYEVFMKTLYEFQKKDLRTQEEKESGEMPDSRVDLTEFQEDAVRRVYSRLDKYGGALVADSVGLGKTFIAKKVIEEFGFYKRSNYLIVTPASLRGMWKREIKDMNLAENIISQEEIARDNYKQKASKKVGGELEDVELIVVDESHNFRNPTSNRWEHLFTLINDIINAEGKKPYVLFLTATPINNTIWDLYWQIMLLVEHDKTAFLKEGIPDLFKKFKEVEGKGDPTLLNDLLNEISIRRTRQYIKENYPDAEYEVDGEKIKLNFPDRDLHDQSYELDDAYQGLFDEISEKITEELTMAYYRLLEYKEETELTQEEELELGRMKGIEGIFRTILLKRLESSIGAFRKSINDHIDFLYRLINYLEEGEILTKKVYRKHLMGADEEILQEEIDENLESFDKSEYNMNELISDIKADINALEEIDDRISHINYKEDAKLQTLTELLEDLTSSGDQVVLFAYYSDTIDYIYKYLEDKLSELDLAKITGDTPTKKREKVVDKYRNGELDVVLSTDVLSEGQNLQSARYLVNYDLHWNPTRMIQRAGRIDRIGTPHDMVHIYNFFPTDELERLLELVSILQGKIGKIDESVGLDQKVLGEEIHPKVFGTIRRLQENDETVLEEQEENQFGGGEVFYQPLKTYLQKEGMEKLDNIPYGVYSGLEKEGINGVFFYYKYKDDFHFWELYDLVEKQILDEKSEIIKFIRCSPDEERVVPDSLEEVFEIEKKVRKNIEDKYKKIEQKSKVDTSLSEISSDRSTKFIEKMIREIELELDDHMFEFPEDDEMEERVEFVREKLLSIPLTKARQKKLRSSWRNYKNKHQDWYQLLDEVEEFLEDKVEKSAEEIEPYEENNLQLVTIEFIE